MLSFLFVPQRLHRNYNESANNRGRTNSLALVYCVLCSRDRARERVRDRLRKRECERENRRDDMHIDEWIHVGLYLH